MRPGCFERLLCLFLSGLVKIAYVVEAFLGLTSIDHFKKFGD